MSKAEIPSEDAEQAAVLDWFNLQYPQHRGRMFAIPNGAWLAGSGKRKFALVSKLKRTGLTSGVPDLMLPVPAIGYHGLFIEMKRTKGSTTSKQQKDWLEFLSRQGYRSEVCKGCDAAKHLISEYLQ